MAANIDRIASLLGAKVVAEVPDTGPGFVGAARLADAASRLQGRSVHYLPLTEATIEKLEQLATASKGSKGAISPIQLATQILEEGINRGLANSMSS